MRARRNAGTGLRACALLACAFAAAACNQGPDPNYTSMQKLVFPWEGQLGEPGQGAFAFGSTAALLMESNYNVVFDNQEHHNLSTSRVDVWLVPLNGEWSTPVPANVRSVFTLKTVPSSIRHLTQPGASFTVVLFDLPNESSLSGFSGTYPFTAEIRGPVGSGSVAVGPKFTLTGNNGSPNPLADEGLAGFFGFQDSLEPKRMIRLRGKRRPDPLNPQDQKFHPAQGSIASVEFDFEYSTSCMSNPRPFPTGEAATATTVVSTPAGSGGLRSVHVAMVHPTGFDLAFHANTASNADETLAGTAPFIDIAIEDAPGSTCKIGDPDEFTFTNLLVTNTAGDEVIRIDGEVEVDSKADPSTSAVLRLYAIAVAG